MGESRADPAVLMTIAEPHTGCEQSSQVGHFRSVSHIVGDLIRDTVVDVVCNDDGTAYGQLISGNKLSVLRHPVIQLYPS